jgi:hypothetical protein
LYRYESNLPDERTLMAGRGKQTFKKRQKEQQRKDRQLAKTEKRLQRRQENETRERSGPEMGEPVVPAEER